MSALHVAILEDDDVLREKILLPGLRRFGFDASGFASLLSLRAHMAQHQVDMALLDIGLPDGSGFSMARELREMRPGTGVVMLTSRSGGEDHVRGLSEGADAYLTKPVDIDVLAATLHSLARRLGRVEDSRVASDGWRLSVDHWCLLSPQGGTAALTDSERKLCRRLFLSPGRLVEREALIEALTEHVHEFDAHRLDSMIHRLRGKAKTQCGESLPLTAVQGRGYILML